MIYRTTLFSLLLAAAAHADPSPAPYVPPALGPWVKWVMEKQPVLACPLLRSDRACIWPGKLELKAGKDGASFSYSVSTSTYAPIDLPGSAQVFPQSVAEIRNGKEESISTFEGERRPFIMLAPGQHLIKGEFRWRHIPRALLPPAETALISLRLGERGVSFPAFTEQGEVLLQNEQVEVSEEDSLRVGVFRKLLDGAPFSLTSKLLLRVSGKAREVELGAVIPEGFSIISVETPLAYRIHDEYMLSLELKPGVFEVNIEARRATPPDQLSPVANPAGFWPEDETWAWVPDESQRSVELHGGLQIEASRTELPAEWRRHAAYVMSKNSQIEFKLLRRGEESTPANSFNIVRTLWLDFSGGGISAKDDISGQMHQGWRLNGAKDLKLGRVNANGQDLLITADPETAVPGVELRDQNLSLTADSRIEDHVGRFSAVGWNHEAQSLRIAMHLPAGWSLLAARGPDEVFGSWLGSWSLLDIFLVILAAFAAKYVLGGVSGLVTFATFVLMPRESNGPLMIWIHLLASAALLKVLPEIGFRKFVRFYFLATLALLILVVTAFTISQIHAALFPQLGRYDLDTGPVEGLNFLVEETFLGWIVLVAILWGIVKLLSKEFRQAALFILIPIGTAILLRPVSFYNMKKIEGFNDVTVNQSSQYVPSAPRVLNEMDRRMAEKPMESGSSADYLSKLPYSSMSQRSQKTLVQVDPKAVVQTGFGIPTWERGAVSFAWNGPVSPDHQLRLYLIGPWFNFCIAMMRIALVLVLAAAFLAVGKRCLPPALLESMHRGARSTAAAILAVLLVLSAFPRVSFSQEFPPQPLLSELEARLLKQPCGGQTCVKINSLTIRVNQQGMEAEGVVSAQVAAAMPLPGPLGQFYPKKVTIDGQETSALLRDSENIVWVKLDPGLHRIYVSGDLAPQNSLTILFAERPGRVTVEADGWTVDGISDTGSVEGSLQLNRKEERHDNRASKEKVSQTLPPWYQISRQISIGLPWSVTTVVERIGSTSSPSLIRLPLLEGEMVNSEIFKVENGEIALPFPRGASSLTWQSNLKESSPIHLVSKLPEHSNEGWEVACSAIWRCRFSGLTPLRTSKDGQAVTQWLPYPGEQVTIEVDRPQGVEGPTVTLDSLNYRMTPGVRTTKYGITLSMRSSKGGFEKITLPADPRITSFKLNGAPAQVRLEGSQLSLPLSPGSNRYEIEYEQLRDLGWLIRFPKTVLGMDGVNAAFHLSVPESKWLMVVGGPGKGPMVLFWSKLIFVLLFAWILGLYKTLPLSRTAWMLLSLGLATLSIYLMLIPVLWIIALDIRGRFPAQSPRWFNSTQVGLAILTLLALGTLFAAVKTGLIMSPDMFVAGNNSYGSSLQWYADRVARELPLPWAFTLPIWMWHVFMLAWSAWLVINLLKWLRWGFESVKTGGFWK